ncbi:hypothetical protein QOT17_025159 [Balamuthia mandrillaris]
MSEQQSHAPGDENDSKGLGTTDKEKTGVMPSLATTVRPEDASSSMAEARAATWNRSAFRNIHSPQRMFMSDPSLSTLKAPPSPGASCWKQGCHCHNFVSNYWQKHFCGNCLHEATFHRRRRHPLPPSPSTLLQLNDGNNFNNNAGEEDESIEADLVKIDKEEREIEGMGAVGPKPSTTFAAKKDEVQQLREMITEDLFAKLGQHSMPAALSPSSSSPTSFVDRIAARTKRPKKNKQLLDQNKETVIMRSSSAPGETIADDVAWMFARQRKKNKQKQQEHMKRDEEQDERRTWLKETEKQRIDDRCNIAFVDSFKRVIEEIVEEQQKLELQLMALSQVLDELEASKQQQCISVDCCFTEGQRAEYVMLSRKRKQRYLHLKSKHHKEQKLRREAEKDLREATYARRKTEAELMGIKQWLRGQPSFDRLPAFLDIPFNASLVTGSIGGDDGNLDSSDSEDEPLWDVDKDEEYIMEAHRCVCANEASKEGRIMTTQKEKDKEVDGDGKEEEDDVYATEFKEEDEIMVEEELEGDTPRVFSLGSPPPSLLGNISSSLAKLSSSNLWTEELSALLRKPNKKTYDEEGKESDENGSDGGSEVRSLTASSTSSSFSPAALSHLVSDSLPQQQHFTKMQRRWHTFHPSCRDSSCTPSLIMTAINNKLKKKNPTILEDNDKVATNNELLYLEEKRAHEQCKRTLEQRIAELEKQLEIYQNEQKKKQIKWDRRQHKRRSSAFHQVVPLIFAAEPPLDQLDDEEEGDALESIADQLVKAQKLILSATHQVNDLSNKKPSQYPARRQQQQREATTDRRRAREHRYRRHNASTWDHRQHSRCQLEEAEERNGEKKAERTRRRGTARSLRRATMRRWTMHPAEFQRSSSAPKTTMYKEQEANKEESV